MYIKKNQLNLHTKRLQQWTFWLNFLLDDTTVCISTQYTVVCYTKYNAAEWSLCNFASKNILIFGENLWLNSLKKINNLLTFLRIFCTVNIIFFVLLVPFYSHWSYEISILVVSKICDCSKQAHKIKFSKQLLRHYSIKKNKKSNKRGGNSILKYQYKCNYLPSL